MKRPGILELRGPVNQSVARLGAGLRSAGESLLAAVSRHPRVAGLLAPALQAERGARERDAAEADKVIGSLRAELVDADRVMAELRTELDESRARAQAALRDVTDRNRQLHEANLALQAELAAAHSRTGAEVDRGWAVGPDDPTDEQDGEPSLRAEVDTLRRKERELLVKANLLSQRVRELRGYADENAAMRNRLVDFDAALARADALQRRVRELEAREFAAEALTAPPLPAPSDGRGTSMGASLDDSLAGVLRAFGGRAAVVADAHGLLMGGAGDRGLQENLAAVAGFVLETAQRAAEFLPLGQPHRVELQYAGGMQLTVRMFACDRETMALTLVRPADLTLDRPVEGAVASIVHLIGAGNSP